MKKKSILIVWGATLIVAVIAVSLIWWRHRDLYLAGDKGPPNRARSFGTGRYVSDIRLGWCNNDGKVIAHNFFTDSLSVTVFLQNFDGWLLAQGHNEPRLLASDLKSQDLETYDSLRNLRVPEFDATLMTLLRISSTAYLGFKFVAPNSRSPAKGEN